MGVEIAAARTTFEREGRIRRRITIIKPANGIGGEIRPNSPIRRFIGRIFIRLLLLSFPLFYRATILAAEHKTRHSIRRARNVTVVIWGMEGIVATIHSLCSRHEYIFIYINMYI